MKLMLFFLLPLLQGNLTVTSPAFDNGKHIPMKYSCEGSSINPPLRVKGIPARTKSLAIIVEDPDAPQGTVDHWVVWNIRPMPLIDENTGAGRSGRNTKGENKYMGPCPPTGSHRYFFKVYALNTMLELPEGVGKKELEEAMKGHVLSSGTLMGTYKKEGVHK